MESLNKQKFMRMRHPHAPILVTLSNNHILEIIRVLRSERRKREGHFIKSRQHDQTFIVLVISSSGAAGHSHNV